MVDVEEYSPSLPSGHPFTDVQFSYYWSSSTVAISPSNAWDVVMQYGYLSNYEKSHTNYVWPVRDGQ
ncbi:MAG: DUF1566 domain-containing protein [bacterium]